MAFTAQRYGLSFAGALVLIAAFAAWPRNGWTIAAAAAFSIGLVTCALCAQLDEAKYPDRNTRVIFFLSTAISGVVVFALGSAIGRGLAFAGITVLYLDLAHLLDLERRKKLADEAAPEDEAATKRIRRLAFTAAIACAVVFGVGCWLSLTTWVPALALTLLVLPILAAPVAIALVSEWGLRTLSWPKSEHRLIRRLLPRLISFLGLLLLLTGTVWMSTLGGIPFWKGVVGVIAMGLLVGLIAGNTPADIMTFLAIIAIVLGTSMAATAPLEEQLVPSGDKKWILAIGDSYMSGEGAPKFYEGTNEKSMNECRRAPTAYPALIAKQGQYDVLFLACSGATTSDLLLAPQYREEPPFRSPIRDLGQITDSLEYRWRPPPAGLTQLEAAEQVMAAMVSTQARAGGDKHTRPEFVLVSIGGNDVGFGEIAAACLLPGDCSELGEALLARLNRVHEYIRLTFDKIHSEFPDSRVVAIPYPIPLAASGCWWSPLLDTEHAFLRHFTIQLNLTIKDAAKSASIEYLAAVEGAFEAAELQICDSPGKPSDAGVNLFAINPTVGDFDQMTRLNNWLHNSVHPNPKGHNELSGVITGWIEGEASESSERTKRAEEETFKHHPRQCTPRRADDYSYCTPPGGGWVLDQSSTALARNIPILAVLLAGAWLFWMPVILWFRKGRARR